MQRPRSTRGPRHAIYQGVTCGPEAVATAAQKLVTRGVAFIRFTVGANPKGAGRILGILSARLAHYGPAKTEGHYIGDDMAIYLLTKN